MNDRCVKGDWVVVRQTILRAGERNKDVPEDTAATPLEAWIKGWAGSGAAIGEEVEITTLSGRVVRGTLTEINPGFAHTYGPAVPELTPIGRELKAALGAPLRVVPGAPLRVVPGAPLRATPKEANSRG